MSRRIMICLVAIGVAGAVALVAVVRSGSSGAGGDVPDAVVDSTCHSRGECDGKTGRGKSAKARPGSPVRGTPSAERTRAKPVLAEIDDDVDTTRTPAERALEERIEKALEDESLEAAIACAGEASRCKVAEIRQNMVDTLSWFGAKALPELTPFLADDDNAVRESAMGEWTMALQGIEDDATRIGAVESAMVILNDEDSLEELSSEYIGVDEKLAVESLVRIIEGGGSKKGVEKAKETYEFVTGDEWAGVEEAARWIAEEYEPPEEP